MKQQSLHKKNELQAFLTVVLGMVAVYWVVWAFTGMWPWTKNNYNSYTLQACRWLSGHLDLGQNYSHLEIAEYGGKFFISFPPFPSYVMLPFALLFGQNTPDGWIALVVSILGAWYVFRLVKHYGKSDNSAIFWTLFVTVCSNLLFLTVNGWVWFFAQNLCFTLSVMALYYAVNKKGGWSLAFWAMSVGCRPFNALYITVLLLVLYGGVKEENPSLSFGKVLAKYWKWVIAPGVIALSYMLLNYLRFGNILEFGHNYLPEFTQAPKGQFHWDYVKQNLPLLFKLPKMGADGKVSFPKFNGMAFYLATPVFFSCFIYTVAALIKRKKINPAVWVTFGMIALHFLALTAHKTM
ncbi:MAG: hypothetical protein IJ367_00925, partial [Clostridia bacterium]|nr:hypothetical protein [Clostridia bacterium]